MRRRLQAKQRRSPGIMTITRQALCPINRRRLDTNWIVQHTFDPCLASMSVLGRQARTTKTAAALTSKNS